MHLLTTFSRDKTYMNTKANRILILALVENKLQSILILSLITNTILMFKTASTSFFIMLHFPS